MREILETTRDTASNPLSYLGFERLRQQWLLGVSSAPGHLPPSVFVHMMDRAYGKNIDRVKLALGVKRPFEDLTDAELAERARLTAEALKG